MIKFVGTAAAILFSLLAAPTAPATAADGTPAGAQQAAPSPGSTEPVNAAAVPNRCLKRVPARGYERQFGATARGAQLRTWSYLGPRAELGRGRVSVRDRKGCVLLRGRTNRQGTFTAALPHARSLRLPLTVVVRDGRAAGRGFSGTMRARVFAVGGSKPITQVGLVSTAASHMAKKQRSYSRAVKKVRRTLRIGAGSLSDALRLRNSDVGYRQLARHIRRTNGGFDAFAAKVARKATKGVRVRGLKPTSATASGPRRKAQSATAAGTAPSTSVCSAPLPSNGSTSDEVITDMATLGVSALLTYAGAKPTSSAASSITGMLLAPLGAQSTNTITEESIQAVSQQLTCLSEQINYLSAQVAELQFTVDVDTATSCASAVTSAYNDYTYLVNNASQYPLNSQNTSLLADLPLWDDLNDTCGADVNDMLFGTSGGQLSAWQQLNENYSSGASWYTQSEVQALQTFLAYWGTILYEQFILTNEYYNYYGDWESAAANAGGTNPSGDSPVCSAGSGSDTPTFCVWQNNIGAAYPGQLFSDEIGMIDSGFSVNAFPGGMVAPDPIQTSSGTAVGIADTSSDANEKFTPTAMNGAWWYNYFLNFVSYSNQSGGGSPATKFEMDGTVDCSGSGCFPTGALTKAPDWSTQTVDKFNGQGTNPNDYGSAVQTFWNPQSTSRIPVNSAQITALSQAGPDGQSASEFLYEALNQTPSPYPSSYQSGGAWTQYDESDATFWTSDTSSFVQVAINVADNDYIWTYKTELSVDAPLGNTAGYDEKSNDNVVTDLPDTPIFGFLLGRTWWPGASSATTYQPPAPPT